MSEDNEDSLLDNLLLATIETCDIDKETTSKTNPKNISNLNEDEFFLSKIAAHELKVLETPSTSGVNNNKVDKTPSKNKANPKLSKFSKLSTIHNGDTDSSDDEDQRDFQNRKYNEYGSEIKHLLTSPTSSESSSPSKTWKTKRPVPNERPTSNIKPIKETNLDILTDPFFGIRISKPLISSITLQDRMAGRTAITMAKIKNFINSKPTDDWVIAGAIVDKSPVKTSQNDNKYIIFTLSDLKIDLRSVSLFLFKNAYKELWKTAIGTVIGVLNPSILENRDGSKQEATVSTDNHQKVMIFGQSKDFGYCKSLRKDGKQCRSFVNTNNCQYCVYHVRQEYQNCARRSELQAKFAGGGLTSLRNKVLGKNEVFYAGKSYMAIPAKASKKLVDRDEKTLDALRKSGTVTMARPVKVPAPKKGSATSFEVSRAQRLKDLELLKKLNKSSDITAGLEDKTEFDPKSLSSGISLDESKKTALEIISKLKNKNTNIENTLQKDQLENKTELDGKSISSNISLDECKKTALDKSKTSTNDEKLLQKAQNKTEFDAKSISLRISLDESKKAALDIISKLKSKSTNNENPLQIDTPIKDNIKDYISKETDNKDIPNELENKILDSKSVTRSEVSISKTKLLSGKRKTSNIVPILSNPNCSKHDNINLQIPVETIVIESAEKEKKNNSGLHIQSKQTSTAKKKVKNDTSNTEMQTNIKKLKLLENIQQNPAPSLSSAKDFEITLTKPISRRCIDAAKQNALKWVNKNGPIQKTKSKCTKKSGVKRFLNDLEDSEPKKLKLDKNVVVSDRFKKIMALTSKHTDLLENYDLEQQQKYFNKLEAKEKMEEKMMSTFKVDCKAVKCLTCKYTNFSAADRCKEERHVLKVFNAVKRFFKCGDCGNRTVSLEIVPLLSCNNCNSSKWERTTMMKEKKVHIGEVLSIRGGEEMFISSEATDSNLNLLVPED